MPSVSTSGPIAVASGPLSSVDADLLVVPWFEDEPASSISGLDASVGGELGRALTRNEFTAKPFEIFGSPVADQSWRAGRVAIVGSGPRAAADTDLLRRIASAAGHDARKRHIGRVAFAVRGSGDLLDLAQASAEGLTLAEFFAGSYKTQDPPP